MQNPKYKWRLDRTEGSRYYGNIGRADAPVLQFFCVLVTVCVCCIVTGVEERVRQVQVWSIQGSRSWGQEGGVAILLMNPGLATVRRGGGIP